MRPMRPRFRLELPFGREELLSRMDAHLECADCPCQAIVSDRHVEVKIREPMRHYWSPQLSLELDEQDDGSAVLHGLFAPNPNVWTMFMAAYSFLGFVAVMGGLFGLSQLSLEGFPWGLLLVPGALVLALVPYGASLVGQRLAAEQMEILRCFLAASLGAPAHEPIESALCPEESAPARGETGPQGGATG